MKNAKDTCLERFQLEWSNPKNSLAAKAKVLDLQLKYVKKLYSLTPEWRKIFDERVKELEKEIANLGLRDFERVQKVIADARRALRSVKVEYGTGFKRKPTRTERREIAQFRPAALTNGHTRSEQANGIDPDSGTDIYDRLLGDDDDED